MDPRITLAESISEGSLKTRYTHVHLDGVEVGKYYQTYESEFGPPCPLDGDDPPPQRVPERDRLRLRRRCRTRLAPARAGL